MSRFVLGLVCGFVSGIITWCLVSDLTWTVLAGGIAVLLVWLFGGLALAVFDD